MNSSKNAAHTEIEPYEVPMEGLGLSLPIITPGSPFHVSGLHHPQEGFEVTVPISAMTRDAEESKLFAAIPTSGAMEPRCPAGEYIIFRREMHKDEPFDHIVYASVVWRVKPKPRRWWQFWRPDAETLAQTGWRYTVVIRHYVNRSPSFPGSRVVLAALAPGFQSFVLGDHNGIEAKATILGIATSRKPTSHYVKGVSC